MSRGVKHFDETPGHRAAMIAGIRALAQFVEDHPELPCPNRVTAQHSFMEPLNLDTFEYEPVPDAPKLELIRRVADQLGVQADIHAESASVRHDITEYVTYVVHAKLHGGAA